MRRGDDNLSDGTAAWHLGGAVPAWLQDIRRAGLTGPVRCLRADRLEQVRDVLQQAWDASRAGQWVCGYVSYEAAPAFDAALKVCGSTGEPQGNLSDKALHSRVPLALFLVSSGIELSDPKPAAGEPSHGNQPSDATNTTNTTSTTNAEFHFEHPWLADSHMAADRGRRVMDAVRDAIAQGRHYQLNLTMPLTATGRGDVAVLFERMARLQPALLGFCVQTPDCSVVSASPELFFEWDGQRIATRPMKGTAAPSGDDDADRAALQSSAKDRTENVMIVDLLRNDLSRIALPGTVTVPSLFEVEVHPTVVQMSSRIEAQTRPGTTLVDVFAALFPCGSVTGAPKHEAMSHLAELEGQPRGVYCGAVGLLAPGGRALFNVAIRTLVHHPATDRLRYDVGSGLTWYSDPQAEWDEWQWKARLAHRSAQAFHILETVRLEDGVWQRQDAHLARMQAAADAFAYAFDAEHLKSQLRAKAHDYPSGAWRGRWLLAADGELSVEVHRLDDLPVPLTLQWAEGALDSHPGEWPFVHHKTTWRQPYERHRSRLPGAPDVLMHACDGALLETPRGNLVLADADGIWTPDSEWQLPGILQQELLQGGRLRKRRLALSDLKKPGVRLWVINSLRAWMPVHQIVSAEGHVMVTLTPDGEAPC